MLVGLLTLRHVERVRGERYVHRLRRALDRRCVRTGATMVHSTHRVLEYLHRDVVLKALHFISYVALLSVRWVERKLVTITEFLRSFRKPRSKDGGKGHWQHVVHTRDRT
jgi:hypothetical protein